MGYLICEKCAGYYELREGESPRDFKGCNCGGNLNYVETIEKDQKSMNTFKMPSNVIIRLSGIFVGAVIMLLPYYLFSADPSSASFVYNSATSPILWVAGGLVAAFVAGGKVKSGISNGFYAAVISGLLVIIFFYLILANDFNSPSLADNIAFFAALSAVYLLVPAIFSVVGGLIGILVRKMILKLYQVV